MKSTPRLLFDMILVLTLAAGVARIAPHFERPTTTEVEDLNARQVSQPALQGVGEEFKAELQKYDPAKAYSALMLYPAVGNAETYLVNMSGRTVHTWHLDAMRARLLPNCNLLVIHGSKWGESEQPWKGLRNKAREYDWNGNLVWEYDADDRVHHDIQRLPNGNTLFGLKIEVPEEYKQKITLKKRRNAEIRSDEIREVNPKGEIVWSWKAHEHLDINSCGRNKCSRVAPGDWTHINTTFIIPENKWYDAGDKRFKPGNILVILRNWWTAMIIDRDSKKPVWEYTGEYKGGLSGGHEAQMIPKGLPGEGNILIFDNGRILHKERSYILEVNPLSKELVWVYDADTDFFSNSAGSMQRLPNGNTFISEDLSGRTFEVTPAGEVVWQYKSNLRIARAGKYDYGYCEKLSELEKF